VCLVSACAFGQGGAVTAVPTITNTRGEPVPYAKVAVCSQDPGKSPATVCNGFIANIYTDISLATACTNNISPVGPISGVGCTNPGKSDGLGNVVAFAVPGQYWCEYFGGSVTQPLVVPCFFANGGGSATLNCPAALNGSLGAFTSPTGFSCDPNMGTDFLGNGFSQSWATLGAFNGFYSLIGGGADPGTATKFKLPANAFRWLAANIPTPYYARVPTTHCTVGQVWQVISSTADANGDIVDSYGCLTPASGGGAQFQTNGVNNANCSGSPVNCPLLNNQSGLGVTVTNPSGGIANYALTGATQIATPSAPTVAPGGTPGSTAYSYAVVGCENPLCTAHTPLSPVGSTSTGNATLSSTNYNLLTAYGDTLANVRGYIICRTAGAATQGVITNGLIAGKSFKDTGLTGDGTNCATAYASNTTILVPHYAALPSGNIPPNGIIGVDAPPSTANASDDEMQQTFGAPADVNNPFWTWGNQQTSTASWSNGTIVLTTGTEGQFEGLLMPLPGSTPYTFTVYVDAHGIAVPGGCNVGFRESATGKMGLIELVQNNSANSAGAAGGMIFQQVRATSYSVLSGVNFWSYRGTGAYLRVQNTGTNIVYSYSVDGIGYQQLASDAVATVFTTGPNQLFIGGRASTTNSVCVFDYERRTQ